MSRVIILDFSELHEYALVRGEKSLYQWWLKNNRSILAYRCADEIANLALACGFPIEIVCPETVDYLVHLKHINKFWDSPLMENWVSLMRMERSGKGWDE